MVYPHRVSFIMNNTKCDICSSDISTGHKSVMVENNIYYGLQVCHKEECKETAKTHIKNTTISVDKLQDIFGDKLYVKRSNGNTEYGWFIFSAAYKEDEDSPYWVEIQNNDCTLSKTVDLEKLKKWNKNMGLRTPDKVSYKPLNETVITY